MDAELLKNQQRAGGVQATTIQKSATDTIRLSKA
jgi:hypothetical protein